MDAFDKADAMVQLWGGLLGMAVMAYFAYRMFFGRKKTSSDRGKPGVGSAEVRGSAAAGAVPAGPDAAGSRSPALSDPQRKTVSGFAKWWLIFWMVANAAGALAPLGSLANSPAPGLAAAVLLLSAAAAVGYYLLLRRNPTGLYVVLAANTLGAFLNGVAVPGYSIMVTTGLIPAILTYFVTRKQVPYPFGRGGGDAPDETGSPAHPEVVQTGDGDARHAALPMPDQPGEADAAALPRDAELPPAEVRTAPDAAAPVAAQTAGQPTRKGRLPLAYALLGAVLLIAVVVAVASLASRRPASPAAVVPTITAAPLRLAAAASPTNAALVDLAAAVPTAIVTPVPPAVATKALCAVQDGKWTGTFGFTSSGCVLSEPMLTLMSSRGDQVQIFYVYLNDEIRVENGRLSYEKDRDGGRVTIEGAFTSPTEATGTWALTKGTRLAGGTSSVTQDATGKWTASLGAVKVAATAVVGRTPTRKPAATPTPRPTATVTAHPEGNAAQPKGTTAPTAVATSARAGAPAAVATGSTTPVTATVRTTSVLDAQVRKLFAPGPDTAGIAVTADAIWVADGEQKRIHHLDRSGAPVGSFQVKAEGEYRGLAWDGEALRLLVHDYRTGSQVIRLDGQGKVLSSFTVPADLHALAWNEAGESFWTIAPGSDGFLLEFGADGGLRQTLNVPVFGSLEGLAWAPDGLWVLSGFGKWHRFGFDGEYLASAELPMEVFAKDPALAWDDDGFLWVSVADTREIFQFALRPAAVDVELPSELRSGSEKRAEGQLPLPRPSFRALPKSTDAVLRVANGLSAPLIVALDSTSGGSVHESAVIVPGETWSGAIAKGGAFTLFASANAAEPVAFYDKVFLLAGYEYTWVIGDAVAIAPPPTAQPEATAVPPTPAPTARSAAPPTAAATRAPARSAPAPAPAVACPDARVRITYPANGAAISGVTNFLGTANLPDQAYYKFEYKPAGSPTWQYLTQFEGKTVVNDKLMDFFTTTIAPGAYDFRLIAVDRSGNYPAPCEIRLTVQR